MNNNQDVFKVKKKDDSIEDKITDMLDKLLKDDEEEERDNSDKNFVKKKDLNIYEKKHSTNLSFKTPILCINSIPFEHSKSVLLNENVLLNMNKNKNTLGFGLNTQSVGFDPNLKYKKRRSADPQNFPTHSEIETNVNTLNTRSSNNSGNQLININNMSNLNIMYQSTSGTNSGNNSNVGSGKSLAHVHTNNFNQNQNLPIYGMMSNQNPMININGMNNFNSINNMNSIQGNNSSNRSSHNLGVNNYRMENYGSSSSVNSQTEGEIPIKTRPKRHVDDGTSINDIDEILENRVKLYEKIDEECVVYFKNNFLSIIKTQNGSRILQRALNKTTSDILSIIFDEIKMALPDLMIDSYANYFCQRFYDFLDFSQKIEFLTIVKDHIVNIGNTSIGTYPLQIIIDQMKTREERKVIIESVKDKVLEMSQHAQGTHVIEKMILCFEEESIKEIYDLILENFMFLACHNNGLCVTKKVISCSKNQVYKETIQKLLLDNASTLVQNPHGNYSIQVALESWDYDLVVPIITLFQNQFFTLSTQKFSSNVVEKCLERGGDSVLSKFLEEICQKSKIVELMKNPYGNYVIQKALRLATGYHKGKLTGIIKKHLEKLHDKKLIGKWKKILSDLCGNNLTINHPHKSNNQMNLSTDSMNNSNNSLNSSPVNSPLNSGRSNKSNNSFNSVHSNNSYNPQNNSSNNMMNVNHMSLNNFNIYSNNLNYNNSPMNSNLNNNMNLSPMNMNNGMQMNVNNLLIPKFMKLSKSEVNSPTNNSITNSPTSFNYQYNWQNKNN